MKLLNVLVRYDNQLVKLISELYKVFLLLCCLELTLNHVKRTKLTVYQLRESTMSHRFLQHYKDLKMLIAIDNFFLNIIITRQMDSGVYYMDVSMTSFIRLMHGRSLST